MDKPNIYEDESIEGFLIRVAVLNYQTEKDDFSTVIVALAAIP